MTDSLHHLSQSATSVHGASPRRIAVIDGRPRRVELH
jgi:hypothetical protein